MRGRENKLGSEIVNAVYFVPIPYEPNGADLKLTVMPYQGLRNMVVLNTHYTVKTHGDLRAPKYSSKVRVGRYAITTLEIIIHERNIYSCTSVTVIDQNTLINEIRSVW